MRIIGGRFRRRKLKSLPGLNVRPTPDRLREALFNVLAPRIEGSVFLDAFAGTGAVGLEAASRGAGRVILIERSIRALVILRENVHALGLDNEVRVIQGNAIRLFANYKPDIAFIDPPYDEEMLYEASLPELSRSGCELAIAQHHSKLTLNEDYGNLKKFRVLRQGDNSLSFYEITDAHSSGE